MAKTNRSMSRKGSLHQNLSQPAKKVARQESRSKAPSAPDRAAQSGMRREGGGFDEEYDENFEVCCSKILDFVQHSFQNVGSFVKYF
jgi:hypothetical protein